MQNPVAFSQDATLRFVEWVVLKVKADGFASLTFGTVGTVKPHAVTTISGRQTLVEFMG